MIKLLLITFTLLLIAVLIFSITQIVKKKGKFPQTHIGRNKNMAKKGISCAQGDERRLRNDIEGNSCSSGGCSTCC